MKRFFGIFLALMIVFQAAPISVAAEQEKQYIFSADTAAEFSSVFKNVNDAVIEDASDIVGAQSCVKLSIAGGQTYGLMDYQWTDYKNHKRGYFVFEADVMPDGESGLNWFGVYTDKNLPISGQLIAGKYSVTTKSPLGKNKWNSLKVVVDLAQCKAIVLNNGVEISDWMSTEFTSDGYSTIRLYPYTDTKGNGVIYFKNCCAYYTSDAGYSAPSFLIGKYDGISGIESYRTNIEDTVLDGEKCSRVTGADAEGGQVNLFTNYTLPAEYRSAQTTVTISVIPNSSVSEIHFATASHIAISPTVPMQVLDEGVWNTLTLITDPSTGVNKLYINGSYYGSCDKPVTNGVLRTVVTASDSNVNNIELYTDNYMICSGALLLPAVQSKTLTVEKGRIAGYDKMTAGELIDSLSFADGEYRAVLKNNGAEIDAAAAAREGMILTVWKNDIFVAQYYLGSAGDVFGEVTYYSNGYADNKFGIGEFKAEFDAGCYGSARNITTDLSQYGADGTLIKKSVNEHSVKGDRSILSSINIGTLKDTYVKFTVKDKNTNEIIKESEKIYPYSETKIESVHNLYKGFTVKAATFSYDDGVADDVKLIKLLDKYGAKATFNLVGSRLENNYKSIAANMNTDAYSAVRETYKNHEIGNHTYTHFPVYLMEGQTDHDSAGTELRGCTLEKAVEEITKNKAFLKEKLGTDTRGIAWPNGYPQVRTDYNELENAVKSDGHIFARYKENGGFELPDNWMLWSPTCHHNNAPVFTEKFVSLPNSGDLKLYSVWGHSYEFTGAGTDSSKNWEMIENTLSALKNDNVWFAANSEIYDYVRALGKIQITDTSVKNNSDITVYVHVNGVNALIEPGEEYAAGQKGYVTDSKTIFKARTVQDYENLFVNPYNAVITRAENIKGHGSCVKIAISEGNTYGILNYSWADAAKYSEGRVVINLDILPDAATALNWFAIATNQNKMISGQLIGGKYNIASSEPLAAGEWNKLQVTVDLSSKKVTVKNNGRKIAEDASTAFPSSDFNEIRLYPYTDTPGNGAFYADNYEAYYTDKKEAELLVDDSDGENIRVYTNEHLGTIAICSYDSGNRLMQVKLSENDTAVMPIAGAAYIKAFLFGSLSGLTPLAEPVTIDTRKYSQPSVACWGDSLTYGQESTNPGVNSYPSVLSELSGAKVYNMGVPGETAATVAARQGAIKIQLTEDAAIPQSGQTEIKLKGAGGEIITPRDVSLGGWNPCTIGGVNGKLEVTVDTSVWPRVLKKAVFIRETPGESVSVPAGTELIPYAHGVKADVNVIFSGTNGGWSAANLTANESRTNPAEIKSLTDMLAMQAALSNTGDKYVVIGLTTYDNDYWAELDSAMLNAFGEKFFNLRKALASEELMRSHGMEPSDKDLEYIAKGAVPLSLLAADETHFNDAGYRIIGELLYDKLRELKYLN